MGNGKTRNLLFAALALLAAAAFGAGEALSPRALLKLSEAEARAGATQCVRGIVTFVSPFAANRFVVAPQEQPRARGISVEGPAGEEAPQPGDVVHIVGTLVWRNHASALKALQVDVVRNETLPAPDGAKQADYRRGLLEGRRISLYGRIREVRNFPEGDCPRSELTLDIDNYATLVRVSGLLDGARYRGEGVRVSGLAHSLFDEQGRFLDAWLEAADPASIRLLGDEEAIRALLRIGAALGAGLLVFASVFLALWLRTRRQRREMQVVAAERARMAADLHDTIEQHLAGANLIAAGVLAQEGVSDDVREAMRSLSSLLANAKAEVRSAVLNLRSAGDSERTLAETIRDMAAALERTGVRARHLLRGLPASLPEGFYQDVVLILREATTNAVKHGRASQILFTADPLGAGGFVLRVLNNGESFAIDRALGPETGHYGLSGMRERALRNHLRIRWGRDGRWTFVELKTEGGTK